MGVRVRKTAIALVAGCLALSGCSTVVRGQPVPADHNGPVAVPDSALRGALLDVDQINSVMHASAMKRQSSGDQLLPDSPNFDQSCLAAWQPIQRSVYTDTDVSAVRGELFREDDDQGVDHHYAIQAVVGFSSRDDVAEFFDRMTDEWRSCEDRTFTAATSNGDVDWRFGPVVETESTLTMVQTQEGSRDWSCQRALRASNNVVIDVITCMTDGTDEATTIVEDIDAKLPSI